MVLSAQTIRMIKAVHPFYERTVVNGMTFGLSPAGYDIRIAENITLGNGAFVLASSVEQFDIPSDIIAYVKDKSSWARKGLCVQNTVIEPGWKGFLTLELTNHGPHYIRIKSGSPIAQIIFHQLDRPTEQPYEGKYQHQVAGPVQAIEEK